MTDSFPFVFPEWLDQAACAGCEADLWFPTREDSNATVRAATAICAQCPVRLQCLDYALENGDNYGIFGGLTATQRKGMKPRRLRVVQ